MNNIEQLLTETEAARFLRLAPGTLAVWRSRRRYNLPFVHVGRCIRYRLSDLQQWVKASVVSHSEESHEVERS